MAHVARSLVVANRYLDSVALLRLSADLQAVAGIVTATAVMATPANLERARDNGIEPVGTASPNDLFVGVLGEPAACDEALTLASTRLAGPAADDAATAGAAAGPPPLHSLGQYVRRSGTADLALISVPGPFAAAEAGRALDLGMHVMLFSDNVSVGDEVALKEHARERGLLVMGPDCGTAIVNGVPLGFANAVRRGPIAVVGASGTGMQEVTARVHRRGSGVSQAIGCGGRDLSEAVGAATMSAALELLAADDATSVVVLVSKPPHPDVLTRVVEAAQPVLAAGKRVVAVFLGLAPGTLEGTGLLQAPTLAAAADLAVRLAGGPSDRPPAPRPRGTEPPAGSTGGAGGLLRGAFTGGTFCFEALSILTAAGIRCRSNLKGHGADLAQSAHLLIDFGDDEFTVGRPHPMIDPTLRDQWVAEALARPSTGVVLLDVVLGHGASTHPVDRLVEIVAARRTAAGAPLVVAHVCGTDLDAPDRATVVARLTDAGVVVADTNDEATRWAVEAIRDTGKAPVTTEPLGVDR